MSTFSSSKPTQEMHELPTVASVIIKKITQAYSRDEAKESGIDFWPNPLPVPHPALLPDPLLLFAQDEEDSTDNFAHLKKPQFHEGQLPGTWGDYKTNSPIKNTQAAILSETFINALSSALYIL